jgi:hypothetical protein
MCPEYATIKPPSRLRASVGQPWSNSACWLMISIDSPAGSIPAAANGINSRLVSIVPVFHCFLALVE